MKQNQYLTQQFPSNVESDLMTVSLSLISLVSDTSSHVWIACELWKNPNSYELFFITAVLIIAPSLFINGLSLYK